MTDNDKLIAMAKSFREATTDAVPAEGSIIGLWMATADALESTTARLREAEAVIAVVEANIGGPKRMADGYMSYVVTDDEPIRAAVSRYKTTKTKETP